MRKLLPLILLIFSSILSHSQPKIEWAVSYANTDFNHFTKDMAIDKEGNLYLTGTLSVDSSDCDFITIKYNSSGNLLWSQRYNGPQGGEDIVTALEVDHLGNVIVTGTSQDTTFPAKRYSATIKYNSNGDSLWVRRYLHPDSTWYNAKGMVIDTTGGIYILGHIYTFAQNNNILLTKFNPQGDIEWQNELDRIQGIDVPIEIKLDKENNIATYNSTAIGGMLIKYNHQGDSISGLFITPTAINFMQFDKFNNTYLGGSYVGATTSVDYYSAKYDSSGNLLWERTYHHPSQNNQDQLRATFLDDSSNFYITGVSAQTGLLGWDYLTIKYSPYGDSLWVNRFAEIPRSNDESVSVVADKKGNVFVTGKSDRFILINRISTAVYDPSGEHLHTLHYDTNYFFTPYEPVKMEIDSAGSIYIAGISRNSFGKIDMIALKYSPVVSSIQNISGEIPSTFQLSQNYPNPFNSQTKIKFSIPQKGTVKLVLFNILGKQVTYVVNNILSPGMYDVVFESKNLSSGIYYYTLFIDGNLLSTKKMVIIK